MTAEVPREGKEGGVFFAHAVQNPNGGRLFTRKADDFAAGTAQFALQRRNARPASKMIFKEFVQNVHEEEFWPHSIENVDSFPSTTIACPGRDSIPEALPFLALEKPKLSHAARHESGAPPL